MRELPVTFSIDKDGDTPIVAVPMSNVDKVAVLNQDDWYLLKELKASPLWRYVNGQVYEAGRARISIARLIVDAKPKEAVQYLDQDAFNLRRSNLAICTGNGKSRERNKLNRDYDKLRQKIAVKPIYINPSYIQQIN